MEFILFINLLVGNIFLSTGLSKCFSLTAFEEAISQFTNFHNPKIIGLISRAFVVLEILCGGLLVCSFLYKVAAILVIVMLIMFSMLIVCHLNKKTNLTCHCGGALGNEEINIGIPVRNLVLIIALLFTITAPEIPVILQLLIEIEYLKAWLITELLVLCLLATYYFSLKLNALTKV